MSSVYALWSPPLLSAATVPLHANVILPGDTGIVPQAFPPLAVDPPILDEMTGFFNFGNGTLTGRMTWSY